jgi:hypothetical protein
MSEYYDTIENQINFDEIDYERADMKKVFSFDKGKNIDIENYLRLGRIFWEYKNINIEDELCSEFYEELEQFKQMNRGYMSINKSLLEEKLKFLKRFVQNGITLDKHFEEMALKILHLSGYKKNIALYFLFKGLNPFLEGKFIYFTLRN